MQLQDVWHLYSFCYSKLAHRTCAKFYEISKRTRKTRRSVGNSVKILLQSTYCVSIFHLYTSDEAILHDNDETFLLSDIILRSLTVIVNTYWHKFRPRSKYLAHVILRKVFRCCFNNSRNEVHKHDATLFAFLKMVSLANWMQIVGEGYF